MSSLCIGSRLSSPYMGGKPMEVEEAVALKTLLLGSATKAYPDGWLGQAFTFNDTDDGLRFGLVQKRGGPCGVLAVVEAFILKNLLFPICSDGNSDRGGAGAGGLRPSQGQREKALVDALTHILTQVRLSRFIFLEITEY